MLKYLGLLLITSCSYAMPITIDKGYLVSDSFKETPKHRFRVVGEVSTQELIEIDARYDGLMACFQRKGWKPNSILDTEDSKKFWRIAVVQTTFGCEYHNGRCNGESDPERGLIIVAYRADFRKGKMPLLEHELAHAKGILTKNHSNLDEVKECTRY